MNSNGRISTSLYYQSSLLRPILTFFSVAFIIQQEFFLPKFSCFFFASNSPQRMKVFFVASILACPTIPCCFRFQAIYEILPMTRAIIYHSVCIVLLHLIHGSCIRKKRNITVDYHMVTKINSNLYSTFHGKVGRATSYKFKPCG